MRIDLEDKLNTSGKVMSHHSLYKPLTTMQHFTSDTADQLWAYLTPEQQLIATMPVGLVPLTYSLYLRPLLDSLPLQRKELIAIAILLHDALQRLGFSYLMPSLTFEVVNSAHPHIGVFTIYGFDYLTETWKEHPQCQTLTQELTELVEWYLH
jgi:hypothetical protein